ncbi:MAG: glucosamine-6-phosphate deaminase [Candidatus Omnitrophota bacterium]
MAEIRESFRCGDLNIRLFEEKTAMGQAAAVYAADAIVEAIRVKGKARVTFATGASQFAFLDALTQQDIPWNQVEVFHLDDYVGLPEDHPASFKRYLRERLLDKTKPGKVHFLNGNAPSLTDECERYSALLMEDDIDLACIGIGENGHLAFNDPHAADFSDAAIVKAVSMDEPCRRQQFGEGWFASLDDVPKMGLTQTIPAIMRSLKISCFVPDQRKAEAVKNALQGPISRSCPASILRQHPNAVLWLDSLAASFLDK